MCTPPGGPNSFNFMQFGENLAKLYVGAPPGSWHPLLGEILDPPLLLHVVFIVSGNPEFLLGEQPSFEEDGSIFVVPVF